MAGRSTENRCVWTGADFKLPVSQIALPRRTLRKRVSDTRRTHSQRAARPLARAPEKKCKPLAEVAVSLLLSAWGHPLGWIGIDDFEFCLATC